MIIGKTGCYRRFKILWWKCKQDADRIIFEIKGSFRILFSQFTQTQELASGKAPLATQRGRRPERTDMDIE